MSCVSLASQEATNVFVNSSTCIDWAGLSLLLARRAVPCCFFVVWMLFNAILGSRKTTEKRYDIVESILSYCFFYERLYIPTFLHNQTLPPTTPTPSPSVAQRHTTTTNTSSCFLACFFCSPPSCVALFNRFGHGTISNVIIIISILSVKTLMFSFFFFCILGGGGGGGVRLCYQPPNLSGRCQIARPLFICLLRFC